MKYRILKEHLKERRMAYLKLGSANPLYNKVHWISTDPFVNLFICQLMKKGRKYRCFSLLLKVFLLIRKWTSLPPLLVFKTALLNMRLFLDLRLRKSGRADVVVPFLLNHKQSILRPLKYLIWSALGSSAFAGRLGVSGQLALAILNIFLGIGPVRSFIRNKYIKIANSQNLLSSASEAQDEPSFRDYTTLFEFKNTFNSK